MLWANTPNLKRVQLGKIGEAYAKIAFLLADFEVYEPACDDRGIDLLVRGKSGAFYPVQVKATNTTVYPFIYLKKLPPDENFIFLVIRFQGATSAEAPRIFLLQKSDFGKSECVHVNEQGGDAGPYVELRMAAKYDAQLRQFEFQNRIMGLT